MVARVGSLSIRLLAAVVVSAVLAACGGGSSNNDAAQVKQTVTRAFRALATGDGATVCSLATPAGQKTLAAALPHSTCPTVIKLVSVHLSPQQKAGLESVQIKKVEVNGIHATVSDADLTSAHGTLKGFINPNSPPTKLTKQSDGSWKLSG
jgi:nitrous oxide reductase accessory protein NosL